MKLREKIKTDSKLYSTFKVNKEYIKPFLEKATPIDYTYHGYKHSQKIESYVEDLIPDDLFNRLTKDEIFILLHGIYYHDIGMLYYSKESVINEIKELNENFGKEYEEFLKNHPNLRILGVDRYIHNKISSERIYFGSYKYNENIIKLPDIQCAKLIADICIGHRDYKNEKDDEIKTLEKISQIDTYNDGFVHTRLLACILRIADELDITNQRAPSDVFREIESFINDKSKNEWLNSELINKVDIDNKNKHIELYPNLEFIKSRDESIDFDRKIIRYLIFSKAKKIRKELEKIRKYIFDEPDSNYKLGYLESDVLVHLDPEIVTQQDYDNYKTETIKEYSIAIEQQDINPIKAEFNSDLDKEKEVKNLDKMEKEFSILLNSIHNEENLISFGNFDLPTGYSSRYYINTNLILPQNRILNLSTDIFNEKFKEKNIDFIIGVGKPGRIIAPNLSLKINANCTYLIQNDDIISSISFEKRCSISKAENILLLTDVISSGSTIKKAIEEVKEKYKYTSIYIGTVFCTNEEILQDIKTKTNINDIYCICKDYQFRIFSKNDFEKDKKLQKEFDLIKKINF
jgi:orotate phosphoribosyltransferase